MAITHPSKLLDLAKVCSVSAMQRAWKNSVRQGLRRQSVADLHDYMDIHRHLASILPRVRADILAGTYRPREPEVITVEKKHGVARRLVIPSPIDSIVLQTLVDAIEPRVRDRQRSKQAYYSRSHDAPSVEDFTGTFGYPWWVLWPHFQREIWKFARECPYTVVTDVANYFDTIPLEKLRNSIATLAAFEESVLDLLFFLLEHFIWRPDYIPLSGVGLPQINFDAPRLLGYAYLFNADVFLKERTDDHFVRWMDDITFGVDSIPEARRLLGELDGILSTLGVRLNLAKTKVLDAKAAAEHFWIDENAKLNTALNLAKREPSPGPLAMLRRMATKWFEAFVSAPQGGVADKIWKRYFTLFSYLQDPLLERHVPRILRENPGLRESATRYYHRLGASHARVTDILEFLESGYAVDDASFFDACNLLVEWELDPSSSLVARVLQCMQEATASPGLRPAILCGALWVILKYADAPEAQRFIWRTKDSWSRSEWAARQVAASYGLLVQRYRTLVRSTVVRAGLLDALQVITHIEQLESRKVLDRQLRKYLFFPPADGFPFPFQKVLLALSLLRGSLNGEGKALVRKEMLEVVTDPVYRALILRAPL